FSSRRRHTRFSRDWSSDVCSSDLTRGGGALRAARGAGGEQTSTRGVHLGFNASPALIGPSGEAPFLSELASLPPLPAPPAPGGQIGRASCRVGVWSSLAAGALMRR